MLLPIVNSSAIFNIRNESKQTKSKTFQKSPLEMISERLDMYDLVNFAALSWQYEVTEHRDSDFTELRQARTTCRFSRHFGPRDRSQLRFAGTLLWILLLLSARTYVRISHTILRSCSLASLGEVSPIYIIIAIRSYVSSLASLTRFCSFFYDCRYTRNTSHHFTLFQHDPEQCTPGGEDGNFIMFARATSGDKRNNNRFSPCSLSAINPVLNSKARSPKGCFTGQSLALLFTSLPPPPPRIEYRIFTEYCSRVLVSPNQKLFPRFTHAVSSVKFTAKIIRQ